MITGFSTSVNTDFLTSADFFASADPSASAGPIVPSLFASLLLLVVLDMTKPFHIGKGVTNADNTSITKIRKRII